MYALAASLPITLCASSTAAAVSAAYCAAARAAASAIANSLCAFTYSAVAALAFAVSVRRLWLAAANFAACASAAFFFAASAFFAASIWANVGFGVFATAGAVDSVRMAIRANEIARYFFTVRPPGEGLKNK